MRGIFASCALAAALLAVTWADHHDHHHHHDHHSHSNQGEMSCHKLSSPNADFAFALYKSLNAKAAAGKNIFFSPLGISTALSMLSTGARGETHSQLFSTLGYSALNQTQVNEAYQDLFHMLGYSHEDEQLDVGNAVAVRSGFTPLEKFVKDVKDFYAGDIFKVNVTRLEEAAAEINTFIANKTQDKIKDVVQQLNPDMAMVLINYVYFKAQWAKRFNQEFTDEEDFHVDNTTKVRVDMMTRTGDYKIYRDDRNQATVITVPYKGNASMMIVLPDEGKMMTVERHISKDSIKHWQASVSMAYVNLRLAKFSISVDASLDDTLKAMGITDAYEDRADFSGVSETAMLKVTKASHKAALSVTEVGTEAAATTFTELMFFSLPQTVRIDRPFLVFILENSTGNILFMGKINNPTAT
ncbi:alpha-1-antitrypsin homolog [Seriola lalandi dorsalis]|uniref:Serpin family A member 4 n=1 Tax=Seriola lalandi dorsalis TaxID=1841481 RepID=A0A3B4WM76_SERLL|nr:alpha-1-antitrypsin homolog [Seriola lalandi dorsalis]XP_023285822.1 alpha-1-antitrypsin homolog [Seriola lalandi dorsalis]